MKLQVSYENDYVKLPFDKDFKILFYSARRGNGKTISTLKYILDNNIPTVGIRRRAIELEKGWNNFRHCGIGDDYKNIKLEAEQVIKDGKLLISLIPLSTSYNNKSSNFDNVELIIFDEYISETRGINNEMYILANLLETINRKRDNVRLVFLSNAITKNNEFFNSFKISKDEIEKGYCERAGYDIHIISDFTEPKKQPQTLSGLLAQTDNSLNDYMFKGRFAFDNILDRFIDFKIKENKHAKIGYNIIVDNVYITVKYDNGYLLLCESEQKQHLTTIGVSKLDAINHKTTGNVLPKGFGELLYKYMLAERVLIENYKIKNIIVDHIILYLGAKNNEL